jgi:hypothetical protein
MHARTVPQQCVDLDGKALSIVTASMESSQCCVYKVVLVHTYRAGKLTFVEHVDVSTHFNVTCSRKCYRCSIGCNGTA